MTAQHTPGPWSDDHLSQHERATITGGKLRLIKTDGVIVAFLPQWLDTPEEASEARANARLIAAAPETAAERDELLRVLQFVAADPCFRVLGSVTQEEVHAAIAKVTGQEGGAA
jgi:hypothetical protein